uniref:Uncharacterized protein n=1 Tax=Chenopodium quinoa TaxID=63459 RepID=A0A803NDS0_CHEQI
MASSSSILLFLVSLITAVAAINDNLSAYEALEPSIFQWVFFQKLKYKPTISGFISKNKLTKLTGVSVKVFFVWLNIVEVRRADDELEFSVGIASANFPIDNFEECPQCGCGLDCVNHVEDDQVRVINDDIRSSVSSI